MARNAGIIEMTGRLCFRGNAAGLTLIPKAFDILVFTIFFLLLPRLAEISPNKNEKQGRVASAVRNASQGAA